MLGSRLAKEAKWEQWRNRRMERAHRHHTYVGVIVSEPGVLTHGDGDAVSQVDLHKS